MSAGPLRGPLRAGELIGPVGRHADRPHVVVKYAQTLDGRIATATGESKWISGEPERALAHALRAACGAVLVGVGTVLRDDPRLTVRLAPVPAPPLRVVLDSRLRTPDRAQVLAPPAPTLLLAGPDASGCRERALAAPWIRVRRVPAGTGGLDLPAALGVLADDGVGAVLVEGGARVVTALLAAGLVDRLVVSVAPALIGSGVEAVGPLGVSSIDGGIRLVDRVVRLVGDDIVVAGSPVGAPAAG